MARSRGKAEIKLQRNMKIFCEGKNTEPNYINGYIQIFSDQQRKRVVRVVPTPKNTPVQLVEAAIAERNSTASLPEDEIWVVYDRESVGKYDEKLHYTARELARNNNINIALNNVCFEYWILLHFVDTNAPFSCCSELLKHSDLNAEVKKLTGSTYEKSDSGLFALIMKNIPNARTRGAKMNQLGKASAEKGKDAPSQINPFVGMVSLLDAVDNFN